MKSTLVIRQAVRPWLDLVPAGETLLVAVSGGADSLALAAGTFLESRARAIKLRAVVVDHQLQAGSLRVAKNTVERLKAIGYEQISLQLAKVQITDGLEASARRARYEIFEQVLKEFEAKYLFLGHTQSDQAENVLLGLARGSGTRSLSGMAPVNGCYIRPLLEVSRKTTESCCNENGISFWLDPQNSDEKYARSRVRHKILPILEKELGPKIEEGLARTARILREDADALDELAVAYLVGKAVDSLEVASLGSIPKAIRARVLRRAITVAGAPLGSISADHLAPVEALITEWSGQGEIDLPGGVKVTRISGRLSLSNTKENRGSGK